MFLRDGGKTGGAQGDGLKQRRHKLVWPAQGPKSIRVVIFKQQRQEHPRQNQDEGREQNQPGVELHLARKRIPARRRVKTVRVGG